MKIKEAFKKLMENGIFAFAIFIIISMFFLLFISIIMWATFNASTWTCGTVNTYWFKPIEECPVPIVYYSSVPFLPIFLGFSIVYFGGIFAWLFITYIINKTEHRRTDRI